MEEKVVKLQMKKGLLPKGISIVVPANRAKIIATFNKSKKTEK